MALRELRGDSVTQDIYTGWRKPVATVKSGDFPTPQAQQEQQARVGRFTSIRHLLSRPEKADPHVQAAAGVALTTLREVDNSAVYLEKNPETGKNLITGAGKQRIAQFCVEVGVHTIKDSQTYAAVVQKIDTIYHGLQAGLDAETQNHEWTIDRERSLASRRAWNRKLHSLALSEASKQLARVEASPVPEGFEKPHIQEARQLKAEILDKMQVPVDWKEFRVQLWARYDEAKKAGTSKEQLAELRRVISTAQLMGINERMQRESISTRIQSLSTQRETAEKRKSRLATSGKAVFGLAVTGFLGWIVAPAFEKEKSPLSFDAGNVSASAPTEALEQFIDPTATNTATATSAPTATSQFIEVQGFNGSKIYYRRSPAQEAAPAVTPDRLATAVAENPSMLSPESQFSIDVPGIIDPRVDGDVTIEEDGLGVYTMPGDPDGDPDGIKVIVVDEEDGTQLPNSIEDHNTAWQINSTLGSVWMGIHSFFDEGLNGHAAASAREARVKLDDGNYQADLTHVVGDGTRHMHRLTKNGKDETYILQAAFTLPYHHENPDGSVRDFEPTTDIQNRPEYRTLVDQTKVSPRSIFGTVTCLTFTGKHTKEVLVKLYVRVATQDPTQPIQRITQPQQARFTPGEAPGETFKKLFAARRDAVSRAKKTLGK